MLLSVDSVALARAEVALTCGSEPNVLSQESSSYFSCLGVAHKLLAPFQDGSDCGMTSWQYVAEQIHPPKCICHVHAWQQCVLHMACIALQHACDAMLRSERGWQPPALAVW